MPNQTLTKLQRNAVFGILQEAGLDPSLFEWAELQSDLPLNSLVSRLSLKSDPTLFYQFDYGPQGPYSIRAPGREGREARDNPGSWDLQLEYCYEWAHTLADELDERDLWAEIEYLSELADAPDLAEADDRPISAEEADAIRGAAERLKEAIVGEYGLNEPLELYVRRRLDYLADSARRQTRLAWMHTAIGVFVSIAWAVSPEDVGRYWTMVREAFQTLVFLIGPGG